jgi:O-acetyl-ADP-ribose deacetylase
MFTGLNDRIEIVQGDITQQRVDAIVNASNPSLLPGLGVCGAIHRAAGHRLAFECAKLGGCKTGQAKLTHGFRLPAPFVIHTVGPVWRGGKEKEADMLAESYWNSLALASQNEIKTLAFPCISTGVYGYPVDKASRVAVKTVAEYLEKHSDIQKVVIVCYTEDSTAEHRLALEETIGASPFASNKIS